MLSAYRRSDTDFANNKDRQYVGSVPLEDAAAAKREKQAGRQQSVREMTDTSITFFFA